MKENIDDRMRARERTPQWFKNEMVLGLMEEINRGLEDADRGSLRFGRLVGGGDEFRALFIRGRDNNQTSNEPTLAFTSFSRGNQNDLPKFVSLEVRQDGITPSRLPRLYSLSWINGLWFAAGCPKMRCVFPWPVPIK